MAGRAVDRIRFFDYDHLPAALQEVSKPFAVVAGVICQLDGDQDQLCEAMQRLIEAKDCAVRSMVGRV